MMDFALWPLSGRGFGQTTKQDRPTVMIYGIRTARAAGMFLRSKASTW